MRRKKNWNILRRLKTIFCFLSSVFCLLALTSCDKELHLLGRWNLQGVSINGEEVKESDEFHLKLRYTNYTFSISNSLNVSTYVDDQSVSSPNGRYVYDYKNKTLKMEFTILYKPTEINAKIKKLTSNEMRLEYEQGGDTYFLKLFSN